MATYGAGVIKYHHQQLIVISYLMGFHRQFAHNNYPPEGRKKFTPVFISISDHFIPSISTFIINIVHHPPLDRDISQGNYWWCVGRSVVQMVTDWWSRRRLLNKLCNKLLLPISISASFAVANWASPCSCLLLLWIPRVTAPPSRLWLTSSRRRPRNGDTCSDDLRCAVWCGDPVTSCVWTVAHSNRIWMAYAQHGSVEEEERIGRNVLY